MQAPDWLQHTCGLGSQNQGRPSQPRLCMSHLRAAPTLEAGPALLMEGKHQETGRVLSKNRVWRIRGLGFMPNPKVMCLTVQ